MISVYTGTAQVLRNFNTSDHVATLVSFGVQTTDGVYPRACHVFRWSQVPWNRLFHYFDSFKWNISGSVDDAAAHASSVIPSATEQFIPSCVPIENCHVQLLGGTVIVKLCDKQRGSFGTNLILLTFSIAADHVYSKAIQVYND